MDPRMLVNQAREPLRSAGLDDPTIERLADRYIAEDLGDDVDAFITWARMEATSDRKRVDEAGEQSFPASDPPSTWAGASDQS